MSRSGQASNRDNAGEAGRWVRGLSYTIYPKGVNQRCPFSLWYGCTLPNSVSCGTDVINHQDKQITPNNPSSVSSSASDQGQLGL